MCHLCLDGVLNNFLVTAGVVTSDTINYVCRDPCSFPPFSAFCILLTPPVLM